LVGLVAAVVDVVDTWPASALPVLEPPQADAAAATAMAASAVVMVVVFMSALLGDDRCVGADGGAVVHAERRKGG
jgi:hypothetical protein